MDTHILCWLLCVIDIGAIVLLATLFILVFISILMEFYPQYDQNKILMII